MPMGLAKELRDAINEARKPKGGKPLPKAGVVDLSQAGTVASSWRSTLSGFSIGGHVAQKMHETEKNVAYIFDPNDSIGGQDVNLQNIREGVLNWFLKAIEGEIEDARRRYDGDDYPGSHLDMLQRTIKDVGNAKVDIEPFWSNAGRAYKVTMDPSPWDFLHPAALR